VKKADMEVPMSLLHTNEIPSNPSVHGEAFMEKASARKSKPVKPKLLRREHSSCVFLVNGSEMNIPDSQVPADWLE
jgi:hypothetical protein